MITPRQISFERVTQFSKASSLGNVLTFVCDPTKTDFWLKFDGKTLTASNALMDYAGNTIHTTYLKKSESQYLIDRLNNVEESMSEYVNFYGYAIETISKGDFVMLAGAEDGKLLIKKLGVTSQDYKNDLLLGCAVDDVASGQPVFIRMFGELDGLDISAPAGTTIWADPLNLGKFVYEQPTEFRPVMLGIVLAQSTDGLPNGSILTKPNLVGGLGELFDVFLLDSKKGDILYNDGTKWINKSFSPVTVGETSPENPINNELWFEV